MKRDPKLWLAFLLLAASVLPCIAADNPQKPAADATPAEWVSGEVFLQGNMLSFRLDKPLKDNPQGDVVYLGSTPESSDVLDQLFMRLYRTHAKISLFGKFQAFNGSTPAQASGPLDHFCFFASKVRMPDDPDATIDSVLQRGDLVLASTSGGLYQASINDKTWHKLDTPESMPPDCQLIEQSPDSPLLACYLKWSGMTTLKSSISLCISKDAGKTWNEVKLPKEFLFREYFIHPDGTLYACAEVPPPAPAPTPVPSGSASPSPEELKAREQKALEDLVKGMYEKTDCRILQSKDLGATWKDITADLSKDNGYGTLFVDPSNPSHIFVWGSPQQTGPIGHARRPFAFEYDAATGHWSNFQTDRGRFSPPANQVGRNWGGLMVRGQPEINGSVSATLSNFFTLPFLKSGNGLYVFIVQVETDKPAYTFRKNGPKIIPVKVVYLRDEPSVKFLDNKDERVFWGMELLPVTKDSPRFDPKIMQLWTGNPVPDLKKKTDAFLDDPNLRRVTLDSKHPYGRDIDLSKMCDFSKPGNYKLQIYHEDSSLVLWGNSFGTQVIDVTITE